MEGEDRAAPLTPKPVLLNITSIDLGVIKTAMTDFLDSSENLHKLPHPLVIQLAFRSMFVIGNCCLFNIPYLHNL